MGSMGWWSTSAHGVGLAVSGASKTLTLQKLCRSLTTRRRSRSSLLFSQAKRSLNKVTDWLKGKLLNLADLHGARPKCQHLPEVKLDMSEDESQISWFCPLRKAVYMVKGMSSDVGVVYASSCNGGKVQRRGQVGGACVHVR